MTLVAIDIGAYSIKAIALDPKRKYLPVAFVEERIIAPEPTPRQEAPTPPPTPESASAEDPTGEWQAPEPEGEGLAESSSSEVIVEPDEDLPGEQPWQQAMLRVLEKLESNGDGTIVALPHGKSFSLQLQELPFADRNKVSKILPAMLGPKLPFGLDQLVYDFFINERDALATPGAEPAQPEAFVGVARRKDVREFLEQLDEIQVNPSHIGIPELMLRYIAEGYVPECQNQAVALIDMGHERTLVHVIENGHTILARAINHGGADITKAIAEKFRASQKEAREVKHARGAILPPSDARDPSLQALSDAISSAFTPLVRDLRRTFQALYARERVEISQVYIFGGNSRITNLPVHLTEKLGIPVAPLDLKGLVDGEDELSVDAPIKMHTALSMALQVVRDRGSERGVNLRQGEFVYRGRSSYLRSQLQKFGAVAALLLVLLGVALFMQKRDLEQQRTAMRAAVTKETKKVFGQPVYKADSIKKRVQTQEGAESGGFVPKMSAYEVFFELSSRIRPDIKLDLSRIEVDAERNLIQLYGTTTSPQAVDDIVSDLEQLECLESIKKDKLQVKKDDEVNFELQIASACS